jgi:tetratricopeptide (TPR) repeat protein
MTQTNLGNALRDQGLRAEGEPGTRLLTDAVGAYRGALQVRTREQLPQDWAATQVNLGAALFALAVRAEGEPKARFFAEALQAYRQALEVFSWEHFPRYWAIARRGETQVLLLTGGDREAAEALSEILARNPRDSKAFYSLAQLLSNRLFEPSRALTIIRQWLVRHPEDLTARILEVEALFASGELADCKAKAASLRVNEPANRHGAAVLLGYQVAAGLAAGSPGAPADLALLRREIAVEPPEFRTGWTFPGALHALRGRSGLPRRDWLVRFFQALESPDRDSILRQLRALQEELGTSEKTG